jgi:hypothetical protein
VAIPHDPTHDPEEGRARHRAEPPDRRPDLETGDRSTLALISAARRALAEAATLPDIRRVMEAAAVAADAGRRAAKLAKAHDLAADVVRDAEAAANDAAAVRSEAQARPASCCGRWGRGEALRGTRGALAAVSERRASASLLPQLNGP